jgi:hypothetical protein
MKLPPIPPNCPYFEQHANDGGEVVWWFISGYLQKTSHACGAKGDPIETYDDKHERGIVAAVARCAWLDEAKRLQMLPDYSYLSNRQRIPGWSAAHANAEAWRLWGEQA